MANVVLVVLGITIIVGYWIYQRSTQTSQNKLPPGPKPYPIVGNIKDFPPDGTPEYQHWLKHKDRYGGVSSVTVLGSTLVMIHDKQAAHDLLEKASKKTSGRPTMIMANKLCGYESTVVCQPYDSTFRRSRKFLHQELGTAAAVATFRYVQEFELKRQLVRALNGPERWLEHLKTTAGATVLKMAYDYTVEPSKSDPLVNLTEQMMAEFSLASVPMAWGVDIFPALQYLPGWFPGVKFKEKARKWRKTIQATAYIPYRFVQKRMNASHFQPSYVSKLIKNFKGENGTTLSHEDEQAILWTAASLYGAGSDTTVISLTTFTLAMVMYPNVQRKAQEEIDRVVGVGRLPSFQDRNQLTYINALVKEILRWWPVSHMGFPHTATEDIEYNGMHIPKGASLIAAVWWFLHDPGVYSDPESFDPDRFLEPRNEPDPKTETFGYGRRICPGRFFADNSIYLSIVQSLAVFNFRKAVDSDGNKIEVKAIPKPGFLTYPTKFDFRIEPRSEKSVQLIRQLEQQHLFDAGDAEHLESVDDFEVY
ncbi:uncharacterized protein N7469_010287 [Penicillium citrinum]|uniref:O-methylsterigmatocystin oxidoreductase n=1 Tax=Penicillium citrinum TaxID=5077 RepID=A0A9W9NK58_PENCI|nr:uncharacterized protein N7469_010287 [Penicillium citrinum]KAJ5221400.1 hypothetical protein N7469_010287 [Penicillium citrinum]